jgi:hypothetical protein
MPTRVYTVLGWVVWQAVRSLAKKTTDQKKVKLGAAATVLGVLIAGVVAARAASSDDE